MPACAACADAARRPRAARSWAECSEELLRRLHARSWRFHRKVWFVWGRWWAVQIVLVPEFSFGVRVEPRRPLIDIFLGVATIAVGRHPLLSDPRYCHRHAGRGFVYDHSQLEGAPF